MRQVRAGREVILSGGAINSPQLLMLSGVGPADALRLHGIEVVADLPGVGQNLQDHLELYVQYECTKPITLYLTENPINKVRIGLEWFLFKSGLAAGEIGDLAKSRKNLKRVIEEFPTSDEAKLAKNKLAEIR